MLISAMDRALSTASFVTERCAGCIRFNRALQLLETANTIQNLTRIQRYHKFCSAINA